MILLGLLVVVLAAAGYGIARRRTGAGARAVARTITEQQLRAAAASGVITAEQVEALLSVTQSADPGESVEAREAFNGVTIAYFLGAFLVLFAFGWFLADRWDALGAAGVLGISLLYTALFIGTSVYLRRHDFPVAGGLVAVLAVGMTPLVTWAVLDLAGLWPSSRGTGCREGFPWALACTGKWMVLELATIAAALIALRRVKFAFLVKPIAVSLLALAFHLTESIFGTDAGRAVHGWGMIAAASVILGIAYTVDRRNDSAEDYALLLYFAALIAGFWGMVSVWEHAGIGRHTLPLVAIATFATSLYLGRRSFAVFGAITAFWYVGYLSFDVFKDMIAFPIMLATFGIVVILSTVWLQRNYPRLASYFTMNASDGRPSLPGGYLTLAIPLIVALTMFPAARDADRESRENQRIRSQRYMNRARQSPPPGAPRVPPGTGAAQTASPPVPPARP